VASLPQKEGVEMTDNPYISFVVVARNDNYGGNFLHRMQISMNSLLTLCERESLNAEFIIVEWNPPDAPRLAEALSLPKTLGVRFIEIPNEIHRGLPNSEKIPIFEYIAKNVGIRRAKGEYVLATNPDIIFSAESVRYLALEVLSPECFYRIDRYDVEDVVPLDKSIEKQLEFCEEHWVKVCTLRGDMKRSYRFLDYKSLRETAAWLRDVVLNNSIAGVHTNASGDFLLMHKKYWHDLYGYPELPTHAHIDSYMCFMAKSLGLRQIILRGKRRIYHQGHERSTKARPRTDLEILLTRAKQMIKLKQPLILNNEEWGLGDKNLP